MDVHTQCGTVKRVVENEAQLKYYKNIVIINISLVIINNLINKYHAYRIQ